MGYVSAKFEIGIKSLILFSNGLTGENVVNFPVKLQGRIHSQPLLINLHKDSKIRALHIVVIGSDGHLYIIDGSSSCFDKIDIGESSYPL